MKKLALFLGLFLSCAWGMQAQSYQLQFGDSVPEVARAVLQPRFAQMLEAGGLVLLPADDAASPDASVMPLRVDAVVTSRMETPGSMSQTALTIDLTVSRDSGNPVSETFSLKGVGSSEDDAWLRAVKQLLPRSKTAADFVAKLSER